VVSDCPLPSQKKNIFIKIFFFVVSKKIKIYVVGIIGFFSPPPPPPPTTPPQKKKHFLNKEAVYACDM